MDYKTAVLRGSINRYFGGKDFVNAEDHTKRRPSCHVALLLLPVVTCEHTRCESLIALGVGCSDLRLGSCPVSNVFGGRHRTRQL